MWLIEILMKTNTSVQAALGFALEILEAVMLALLMGGTQEMRC
jgi:hypothetical protein